MKKIVYFHLLTFVVLLLTSAPVSASTKDEWVRIKSKNFNMVGNATDREIRLVATKLEQFREVFRQLFPQMKFTSPVPINVIVFKDDSAFAPFKPVNDEGRVNDWVAGYFLKGEDVNYITLAARGDMEQSYQTIFHEYTHFLVDNAVGRSRIPAWFNEGLAEYYERFQIENGQKVTLGAVNANHLVLLARQGFIPFETFFETDYYSMSRQGKDRVDMFYAQAWALMHYFLHGDGGAHRGQLTTFIDFLAAGKSSKEAFAQAFKIDNATLEIELKKYIEQKKFNVRTNDFDGKLTFDAETQSSPVSDSESKAILGDLLYHWRRFDDAAIELDQALQLNPNSAMANMTLGLVRMKQENFAEAKRFLKKALALDDKNYLLHYQYAYVLSRESMTASGFVTGYDKNVADEVKAELKKSIALNPDYAENYSLFAFVSAVRNEDVDEASRLIQKALAISPGNEYYLIRSAELNLRKENFGVARMLAKKVFDSTSDGDMRLYAQNTIFLINSTEAQMESIRSMKNNVQSDIITDQPISDEELARRNAAAINLSLNQSLRRPGSNEKRFLGYLSKIECFGKLVEFSARIENQVIKLQSTNFDSLVLMSFNSETSNAEVGCGTFSQETFTVITYRPSLDAKSKYAGEIVAIEFMPKNFRLMY